MNTSYLKYVVEVGRVQSITKAAQNLYMGQPNLSKAIKELEKEIGITIFRRTAKGVVPTAKGKEFLGYAQGILSQIDELESLYKPRNENALELSVAMPRSASSSMVFAAYLNSRPDLERIDIHFQETGAINAVHLVSGGEMDLGVIRYQASQAAYPHRNGGVPGNPGGIRGNGEKSPPGEKSRSAAEEGGQNGSEVC